MKKTLLLVICLSITFIIHTEQKRWIDAGPGLRMRSAPNLKAEKIVTIPYGEEVILLEETGETLEIAGARGKWSKVDWDREIGWVFGGFLTTEDLYELLLMDFAMTFDQAWYKLSQRNGDYVYLDSLENSFTFDYDSMQFYVNKVMDSGSITITKISTIGDKYILHVKGDGIYYDENETVMEIKFDFDKLHITGLLEGVYATEHHISDYIKVPDDERLDISRDNIIGYWTKETMVELELLGDGSAIQTDPGGDILGNWRLEDDTIIVDYYEDHGEKCDYSEEIYLIEICYDYMIVEGRNGESVMNRIE